MSSTIKIQDLTIKYTQSAILKNITLEIPKPSFVAIIGLNGCGKSTFLKALSGKISYQGSINEVINNIAYLGQQNNVRFNLSVQELLLMGGFKNTHFTYKNTTIDQQKAYQMLIKLNIEYLWNKNFKELSGGEQQLLWIVQILLQQKEIFLLDEPTQQLDVLNKKKTFILLENLVKEQQKTVFCVTHDIYNLKNLTGYLLNLSKKEPLLEPISYTSITSNIEFLEKEIEF